VANAEGAIQKQRHSAQSEYRAYHPNQQGLAPDSIFYGPL